MIKSLFENLTLMQKVQLYLLIPMLFWLLLFGIETNFTKSHANSMKSKNNIVNIKQNKLEKITPSKIIRFLEDKIELYKVSLHTIDIKKSSISIRVSGEMKNILSFLQKIQIHLEFVSFELLQEQEDWIFHLVMDSKYFFNKELLAKEFNPENQNKKVKENNIKLEAIVGNEVLINNVWYQKGKIYNSYQIVRIGKNFILLKDAKSEKSFQVDLLNESL